jgi:hypothetical protein
VDYSGEYDQVELDVQGSGDMTAEYTISLGCQECSDEVLSGTIEISAEPTEAVQTFIDKIMEEARLAAKTQFLGNRAEEDLDTDDMLLMEEACDEAELGDDLHEFEIEEQDVTVYEDTDCGRKTWVLEVTAKITDTKHPEWDGEVVTLKDSILQGDMEEA